MKQIVPAALIAALFLLPPSLPAMAQDAPVNPEQAQPAPDEGPDKSGRDNSAPEDGAGKMQKGLKLLMDGLSDSWGDLADKAGPKVEKFFEEMGPALKEAIGKVGDLNNYEKPEVLPNGDILIKRKDSAPKYMPPVPGQNEDGSVDL